jgi:sugar phosphate isomerase/epimerase
MKTNSIILFISLFLGTSLLAQLAPSGNPKDFKVKTCLHSIGYSGLWRGQASLSVDAFLLKAKELGFDGVILMAKRPHVSPLDYDAAARLKLKNRIKELGLTLVCLAGYTDFTAGIEKPGIPMVEIQVAYVEELAKLAQDLGTNMVRIFTAFEREGIPFDKQYAMVLEGLKLAGEKAAKYGVTLVVQNHHDIALHHDAMYWLLKEVNHPNVKASWDAWSPAMEGLSAEEIRASVLKMKPYILNTIAADYVKLPRYHYESNLVNYTPELSIAKAVAMGEGMVDYKTFFNALKEIGYQGYIAYEMCAELDGGGSIENLDKTAKKFLQYVKQF